MMQMEAGANWLVPFLRVMVFVASQRKFRHGTRLVPLCGTTMYLVEQVSGGKTLHRSQAVSLSLQAPGVCKRSPDSSVEREFRFGENLVVWQTAVIGGKPQRPQSFGTLVQHGCKQCAFPTLIAPGAVAPARG